MAEFKVRDVSPEEEKSTQEVEAALLKKHEEQQTESVEAATETTEVVEAPVEEVKEIEDADVLSYIKNRYNRDINSVDELFDARESNEDLPEDVATFLKYKKEVNMKKFDVKTEDGKVCLGLDLNGDGQNSIDLKLKMSEAIEEAFARGEAIEGAKVVVGCPGTSLMSPERVPGFTEQLKSYGVPLVEDPTEMIGQIDGVLIESVDGSVHYDRAKPFLEAGVPMFIDKPFACSLGHAKAIVELAEKNNVTVFSSSSLRYGVEVQGLLEKQDEVGKVVGADAYSPG